MALRTVSDPRWVEKQTGVALATLKTHYERWMPDPARDELQQLGRAFGAGDVGQVQDVDPKIADVDPSVEIPLRNPMRGGGLEPDGGTHHAWIFKGFASAGIRR